jgi:endonuclease/exonuclease/phosphatase family metal-dependent hydrolase
MSAWAALAVIGACDPPDPGASAPPAETLAAEVDFFQPTTPTGPVVSHVSVPHTKGDFDGDGYADIAVFRPSTGQWFIKLGWDGTAGRTVSWGTSGDVPVAEDYDGDGIVDVAVWRPWTGEWWILSSSSGVGSSVVWGERGDIPVPADYDGDNRTDLAVWRPRNGTWYILKSRTNEGVATQWGTAGDIPVPADYDGDRKTDTAVWRPSNGTWYMIGSTAGIMPAIRWGEPGDVPMPINPLDHPQTAALNLKATPTVWRPSTRQVWTYGLGVDNDTWGGLQPNDVPVYAVFHPGYLVNLDEKAFWNPSTGMWRAPFRASVHFGVPGDIPATRPCRSVHPRADYDGDGRTDRVVWRPDSGNWYQRFGSGATQAPAFGTAWDMPLVGDFDGDGFADPTVFRHLQSTAPSYAPAPSWWISNRSARGYTKIEFGTPDDWAVSGDFDGDGVADPAVYFRRPSQPHQAIWKIRRSARGYTEVVWGDSEDFPVPADYDGDGITDVAVFRPSTGQWWIMKSTGGAINPVWGGDQFATAGRPGDIPTPGDFDGDGLTDLAYFRTTTSTWAIKQSTLGVRSVHFGEFQAQQDVPVVGDYDGDGRADVAVWRPTDGNWHVQGSSVAQATVQWGVRQDVPPASIPWTKDQSYWPRLPGPLTFYAQNMGLMVFPAPYKGESRWDAINRLVSFVREKRPDVVGLSEVWDNYERDNIRTRLADLYPSWMTGPDEADLESDGGLLLLSRFPLSATDSSIYRNCAAEDCLANKGVLHARVQPPGRSEVDVFLSHTQNPDVTLGPNMLNAQINHLADFVMAVRNPRLASLVMGDLNVDGMVPTLYQGLVSRMGFSQDAWKDTQSGPGITYDYANCVEPSKPLSECTDALRDKNGHRLDYFLGYDGLQTHARFRNVSVIKLKTPNGRDMSDHYGIWTELLPWELPAAAPQAIYNVSVHLTRFQCLMKTDGVLGPAGGLANDDEIEAQLSASANGGTMTTGKTGVYEDISHGAIQPIYTLGLNMGIPAGDLIVSPMLFEVDDSPLGRTGTTSLENPSITLGQADLRAMKGKDTELAVRGLGAGGEYVTRVQIRVD